MKTKLIILAIFIVIIGISIKTQKSRSETLVFPTPTISPAQEASTQIATETTPENVVPEPTQQQVGRVTFHYKLTEVIREEMFGGTYVNHETLTFTRNSDGTWSSEYGAPKFMNLGPLYQIYDYEALMTTSGDCGINTYPLENYSPIRQFQPICDNIASETMATITFGLENCDVDILKNIICTKETLNGQLHYKLYKNLDAFEFYYTGFWSEGEYPGWINQATQTLGFSPVSEDFYKDLQSGQNYTINKNSK